MNPQDLFVGTISILTGAVLILVAIRNWERFFALRIARRIDHWRGRPAARCFYGAVGTGLVILGVIIASGLRLWS